MKSLSWKRGFTLIELLVVIAVIGIPAAVVLASLNDARAKARDARRVSDMKQVQTALELYRNDNGDYPIGTTGTIAVWNNSINTWLVAPGHLAAVPADPQAAGYHYYSDFSTSLICDGKAWPLWEYVIIFKNENPIPGFPDSTHSTHKKCVHGALKE